jgi:hypothetical protein
LIRVFNRTPRIFYVGNQHGKGIFITPKEGDYKDDKMRGKGIITFQDGNKYEGDYNLNKKHVKSIYTQVLIRS